jgi:hypothetical protein
LGNLSSTKISWFRTLASHLSLKKRKINSNGKRGMVFGEEIREKRERKGEFFSWKKKASILCDGIAMKGNH